ncbi:MAG: hypothetical protein GC137_05150 [Alphaproteobacteria bacterium]|nr:hypothetical protein [Alphaproteobacteria bacterium]
MSLPLVKYVLMAAVRDRLILSMIVVLLISSSLAVFLGSAAVIEKDQFTVVFVGSSLRLISILGLILFVIFFVRRSFDNKDIEFLLSRPVSRLSIIFSYSMGCMLLAFFMSAAVALNVIAVAPHLVGEGHVYWIFSVMVESVIMVNIALFFAMYISSAATASLISLCVYILGRMMGQFLGIVDSDLVDSYGIYAMATQAVSVITPRLDLLGQTSWLIYGVEGGISLPMLFLQAIIFSFLVLMASAYDFSKRQF